MFYQYGIPYQYEPRFELKNGKVCYPDFVLLNVRERKTYYWEHFGLASKQDYSDKNLEKLAHYERAGLYLGVNFIMSVETEGVPLDIKLIEEKIRHYLM